MNRLTPSAGFRTHLLVAACLWAAVGLLLFLRGLLFLLPAVDGAAVFWIAPAMAIGVLKALWVLDRVAQKNMDRIEHFDGRTCIGGVYSWKTWGLVVVMILSGRLLRATSIPATYIGAIYIAVGTALTTSSRLAWSRWRGAVLLK